MSEMSKTSGQRFPLREPFYTRTGDRPPPTRGHSGGLWCAMIGAHVSKLERLLLNLNSGLFFHLFDPLEIRQRQPE